MRSNLNFYVMRLQDISLTFDADEIRRRLAPAAAGVRACEDAVRRANASSDQEYQDAVVDDEAELVEMHFGLAFVTCQILITGIVSRVKSLQAYHRSQTGNPLSATGQSKGDITGFGNPRVKRTTFTRVQVVDAFANYFKHRDEWHGSWHKATGRRAGTVAIISAAGAREGSTGNLRTGAKALGIAQHGNLDPLANILEGWKRKVWAAYSKELRQKGLA